MLIEPSTLPCVLLCSLEVDIAMRPGGTRTALMYQAELCLPRLGSLHASRKSYNHSTRASAVGCLVAFSLSEGASESRGHALCGGAHPAGCTSTAASAQGLDVMPTQQTRAPSRQAQARSPGTVKAKDFRAIILALTVKATIACQAVSRLLYVCTV